MICRRQSFAVLWVVVLLLAVPRASVGQDVRPDQGNLRFTVAVEKFDNQSGREGQRDLGSAWKTILTSALQQSGSFIVIAETDMVRAAQDVQLQGETGTHAQGNKTARVGNLSSAQLLVKGVITEFHQVNGQDGGVVYKGFSLGGGRTKTLVRAVVQLVDTTTGQVVASQSFTGEAQKRDLKVGVLRKGVISEVGTKQDQTAQAALENAIHEVMPWLVDQLPNVPWRGSVIQVSGGKVYINRGTREGVVRGETFSFGESEILHDPATGEVLDIHVTRRGKIRADEVRERVSICSVIEGDPSTVLAGMGIER